MRISTAQLFQQGVSAMQEKQRSISETELQVATGQRILRPSDDPSAAVRVFDLKESAQRLAQYQRNADAALARLDQEETALISVENLLQRVRELGVQGNNGVLSTVDRQAIAAEVRQHVDSFLQLANSKDANNEYIFAGFKGDTQPWTHDGAGGFVYHGDDGQRRVKIGASREVAIGDPGTVFAGFASADPAKPTTDIGEVMYTLAANLQAGNADGYALDDLDTALNRIFETRARIGARMNAIEDQKASNDAFDLAVSDVRSTLEDLDYAEAISRFNQQLTALQASQQAFVRIQDLNLFNYLR